MQLTEEQKAEVLAQYGTMQDLGAEGIRDMMTLDFGTVLISLVIAVFIVAVAWSWIEKIRDDAGVTIYENREKGGGE